MKKNVKKQAKKATTAKKGDKKMKNRADTAEYVGHLVELHKVQGAVLRLLQKSI